MIPVYTSHLSAVYLRVHLVQVGNEGSLGVVDLLVLQLRVVQQGLGFVVVSQVGAVKNPHIRKLIALLLLFFLLCNL